MLPWLSRRDSFLAMTDLPFCGHTRLSQFALRVQSPLRHFLPESRLWRQWSPRVALAVVFAAALVSSVDRLAVCTLGCRDKWGHSSLAQWPGQTASMVWGTSGNIFCSSREGGSMLVHLLILLTLNHQDGPCNCSPSCSYTWHLSPPQPQHTRVFTGMLPCVQKHRWGWSYAGPQDCLRRPLGFPLLLNCFASHSLVISHL